MAKLISTVYVRDPETVETVTLEAGSEPEPRLAALVTNPAAWEDGKLPPSAQKAAKEQGADTTATASSEDSDGGDGDTKPAARTAAKKPARGRAADSGDGS